MFIWRYLTKEEAYEVYKNNARKIQGNFFVEI